MRAHSIKWVSKKIPLAAVELAWVAICWPFTFLLLCTPSLCLTHLCFCKDIQMHTIHTSRYLCDSWAKSSYIQKKWKSKLCWQFSWKGIRWWVRTKSEKSILRHYMYHKISFLSYGFVLRCEILVWRSRYCGILASGMGRGGGREGNWEDKISPKRAKNGVSALDKMDQIGPKMDQQGLKIVLLYQKYFFFLRRK